MTKDQELAEMFTSHATLKLPAYKLLKDIIASQVRSGRWSAGEIIPSENELVAALGISRMTVNRAIRELTGEGLLTRIQGIGTFVSDTKSTSSLFEVRNIADEVTERGHQHSTDIVLMGVEYRKDSVQHFDIEFGKSAFHSVLVHYDNGRPIQLEDRYVNREAIPQYIEQDFTQTTPNTYLTDKAPLTRGEHVVEAVLPTSEQAELLGISPADPCLRLSRKTWSGTTLISAAVLLHPGSSSRLEGTFGA